MLTPISAGARRAGAIPLFLVLAVASAGLALPAAPADAITVQQALAKAYRNNAQLKAQRAALDAAADQVQTAKSGWKPHVDLSASAGRTRLDGSFSPLFGDFSNPANPILPLTLHGSAVGVSVRQPIYEGGRTSAAIDQAQSMLSAQGAMLQQTEQQVFLQAAQAYIGVLTDQAVLRLEQNNVNVLKQQLDSAQANLNAGEATRTDVAQSQARLAGARAQVIQARGNLREDRASFRRIIGVPASNLTPPPPVSGLPSSLAQARQLASQNYPVIAARYAVQAAQYNVDTVKGQFSPSLGLSASYLHANDPQFAFSQLNTAEIMLSLSIPIYQGGALHAQKSHARHLAEQRRDQLLDAQRMAVEQVTRAWQAYKTAHAALKSIKAQIQAAQIAFKGVKSEHRVGERTQLDVLDAQQDLLSARVSLVRAEATMRIAAYALKANTGTLTADAVLGRTLQQPATAAAP
ncbi:MAG TPA: TolC family outer membrane protein [Gammaproteobacteria bacterium]|nr:TolC family outer membrane protein [Gammaproteobacteria bacterium]